MTDFTVYPPLVEVADLPSALQGVDQVDLDAICEAIRGYCGWHIAPSHAETIAVDQRGKTVVTLPTLHLTDVTAVVDANNVALDGFTWSELGQLERDVWPQGFRAVKVSVEHGYSACPASIVSVVADMVRDHQSAAAGGPVRVQLDGGQIDYGTQDYMGVRRRLASAYGHILGRFRL